MAEAPGHKLGQIIGHALEIALEPLLRAFAEEHELYLDKQGTRPARPGRKVTWVDENGNSHDLDFVLERGGSADKIGIPVAFIESAWRRYTKHSRNKAQEIQGAVEPLIRKWASVRPLGGAIVGGQWTRGALDQLRSLGFVIAYIPYEEVVRAFMVVGMTVATTESTTDGDLADEVRKFEALAPSDLARLGEALRQCAPTAPSFSLSVWFSRGLSDGVDGEDVGSVVEITAAVRDVRAACEPDRADREVPERCQGAGRGPGPQA